MRNTDPRRLSSPNWMGVTTLAIALICTSFLLPGQTCLIAGDDAAAAESVLIPRFAVAKRIDLRIGDDAGSVTISKSTPGSATIKSMVENGASIKKGDLLIEFDSTRQVTDLHRALIDLAEAEARSLKLAAEYEREKSQIESSIEKSRLTLEAAERDLKTYVETTMKLQRKGLLTTIEEKEAALKAAHAKVKAGQQAKNEVARAQRELWLAESSLKVFDLSRADYEIRRRRRNVEFAAMGLKRAVEHLEKAHADAKIPRREADLAVAVAKARVDVANEELKSKKQHAPIDGIVRHVSALVQKGDEVFEGQPMLTIIPKSVAPTMVLKDALVVPIDAILTEDDQTWCLVKTEHGVDKRKVKLSQRQSPYVQVVEGLWAGNEVLLLSDELRERL